MIAFIIDHPNRELPYLVKLAENFLSEINNVFIVPMYDIDDFFLSSQFAEIKVIVFNYIRKNNLKKIEFSHAAGKINVIYDTEGAPDEFTNLLKTVEDELKYIDLYLFWGSGQLDQLKKRINFKVDAEVVGFLRHINNDFKNYENLKISKKKYVLVNTNFSAINPRFDKSIEDNLKKLSKIIELDIDLEKFIEEKKIQRMQFLKTIEIVSKELPHEIFIIRPHPFENRDDYFLLEQKYKNIFIDKSFTSVEAIKNSKVLLHLDCTTSIEAYFLGTPSISLNWINRNSEYTYMLVDGISFKANSIDDVIQAINDINKGKKIYNPNISIINKFFGTKNNDINSFKDAIIKISKKNKQRYTIKLSLRNKLIHYIKLYLPIFAFNTLSRIYFGNKVFNSRKNKKIEKIVIKKFLNDKYDVKMIDTFFKIEKLNGF